MSSTSSSRYKRKTTVNKTTCIELDEPNGPIQHEKVYKAQLTVYEEGKLPRKTQHNVHPRGMQRTLFFGVGVVSL